MKYTVIGSGVSGVNAALTLLERGKDVVMYDVGREESAPPLPQHDFYNLKDNLESPYNYFLGKHGESILPPCDKRGFVFPPSRNFYIKNDEPLNIVNKSSTFMPVLSLAQGGLGIAWGANAIEFNDADLSVMGLDKNEFYDAYKILSKRISIAGPENDQLSDELKSSLKYNRPLNLNAHENFLFQKASKNKGDINLGRARMAIETRDYKNNQCTYCGRCIWGCGVGAIYNPAVTLRKCLEYSNFQYVKNTLVISLISEEDNIVGLNLFETTEEKYISVKCEKVLLAAGAINSAAIFLRTINSDLRYKCNLTGYSHSTKSLLDTSVLKLPYIYPKMIGKKTTLDNVQFNKLIIGYVRDNYDSEVDRYIHGEVVTLSSLLYHPIIEELPFDTKTSFLLFKYLKNSIGVVTYFLPDHPINTNHMTLVQNKESITNDELLLKYTESSSQAKLKQELKDKTMKYFLRLGCYMPKDSHLSSSPGAGIHYAGTMPYSKEKDKLCTDKNGRCYAYKNLYAIDGSTLPALPSKSITYNLMANSIRISNII